MSFQVKYISTSQTKQLRHLVLRQGKPKRSCDWEGDELESTKHIGAFLDSECVGILSLFYSTTTKLANPNQYQLRGMAVDPKHQGQNIGRELVRFSENELKDMDIDYLWCNARRAAVSFYEKLNFKRMSEEFFIPDVGPHFVMSKKL